MTTQPRLVNKQFNSPIGLYSPQNVQEVLQREQQILSNGAIGIDFHNPSVGKPANLQNSAVLRMLEEEENRRGGRTGNGEYDPRPLRDVSWPPPEFEQKNHLRTAFKDVVIPGAKRVAWPPPQEGVLDPSEVTEHSAVQSQGGTHYSNQSSSLQQRSYSSQQTSSYQQQQQSHRPLKPLDVSSVSTGSPLGSPSINQSPQAFRPATPAGSRGWAPVHSPVTTPISQKYFGVPAQGYQQAQSQAPGQYQQPQSQAPGQYQQSQSQAPGQYQHPGQQYQQQQFSQPPQGSAPEQFQSQPFAPSYPNQAPVAQAQVAAPKPQPAKRVEPPPSTITLRPTAPVSQTPPMVYSAQPATASLKGGKHLRGDMKWPPEDVRQRMEDEKRHLMELAKGPACKPRRKERDYTPFFAQHALNSTYPGYKIPPGTQFYRPE